MPPTDLGAAESDPRFPSGAWTGFYRQGGRGRVPTDLWLSFQDGRVTGTGEDVAGRFRIDGTYDVIEGKCAWTKAYYGKHEVAYQGMNEGKGIWGGWQIDVPGFTVDRGVFHIWPADMDPGEEADFTDTAGQVEDRRRALAGRLARIAFWFLLAAGLFALRLYHR